jgi:hypothetical protein
MTVAVQLAHGRWENALLPKMTFAMRCGLAFLLTPALAHADVRYTMISHPASSSGAPTAVEYLVGKETVRVEVSDARHYQLFKNGTIYLVDIDSRSVQTVPDATLSRIKQLMADQVKKMENMASKAPPGPARDGRTSGHHDETGE